MLHSSVVFVLGNPFLPKSLLLRRAIKICSTREGYGLAHKGYTDIGVIMSKKSFVTLAPGVKVMKLFYP
jgi:hypothetical protein